MSIPLQWPQPGFLPPRMKIAYIKRGTFSYSNQRTAEQLRQLFPEYELEEIDVVEEFLRPRKWLLALNLVPVVRAYWRQLLFSGFSLRQCFYRTPYMFRKIREALQRRLSTDRAQYAFSVQTQSLFDASVPGLPHFVYTDHTHLTNLLYPGFSRRQLYARSWIDLEQEIYRNAAHVFVMSEHVRRSLAQHYGCAPGHSTCVLAGSNIETEPLPLENDGYANQTIVFVGVDWERKGGPTLLKAFEQVLAELPEARLIIVGCEPEVRHPRIEVVGRVAPAEVKRQLVRGSLFCLPTRIEPFGIAAVEAFFHKLPVVTTDLGAMADLVRHGQSGLLVQPDDAGPLAQALLELLRDPEKCRSFAEYGYRIVTEGYTWPAVGQRLREGITSVLAKSAAVAA